MSIILSILPFDERVALSVSLEYSTVCCDYASPMFSPLVGGSLGKQQNLSTFVAQLFSASTQTTMESIRAKLILETLLQLYQGKMYVERSVDFTDLSTLDFLEYFKKTITLGDFCNAGVEDLLNSMQI